MVDGRGKFAPGDNKLLKISGSIDGGSAPSQRPTQYAAAAAEAKAEAEAKAAHG